MALLIGMDEAGYGPNLGPLVISATAWEVPGDPRKIDLWEIFAGIVEQTAPVNGDHIQIADSKQVYTPARGFDNLEAGVLHALAVWLNGSGGDAGRAAPGSARVPAESFREILRQVAIGPPEELDTEPWFDGADLPVSAPKAASLGKSWLDRCRSHDVRLRAICSDVVLTRRFNEQTRTHDSKGRALSEMSMHLLRHIWQAAGGDEHDRALIIADKHGGRNRYHEFLPIVFGNQFIRCHNESTEKSRYSVGRAEIRFETKSERHLPVALASMVSKYLRELSMALFNRFWTDRQPGLKLTAGYPVDALRFKADIAALQKQLGIADEILWRER
ncbi:MAG: hypothetical protein ACM3U2_14245 [Deltaproteobacteria bacterium]